MSCLNNWMMILLIVCFPLVYSQAVLKLSETKPFDCKKEISMTCTITGVACCTGFTRFWRKDNQLIMTDGVETNPLGKYSEKVNSANFVLTINDLHKTEDSGHEFTCSYQAYTSPAYKFNIDDILCPPCWECVKECFLKTACYGIPSGYCLEIIIFLVGFCCCCKSRCYKYLKVEPNVNRCSAMKELLCNKQILKTLGISSLVTVIGYIIIYSITASFSFGWYCYICYYSRSSYLIIFGLELLILNVIFYWTRKLQKGKCSWQRYIFYVIASFLIFPIWIPFLYHSKCPPNGENSQSVDSGSSCWPICRVGQDPNTSSSDPEKVRRSSKKESADKKPTGFVRPQPSRAQHLGTDNTGRAEYSAENEMYSEKLLKSNKPRLLPSIGQQTDSPRPLPQMPASAQQGGNQLAPLEKKKKKRKKKREAKQSDEENSTEL